MSRTNNHKPDAGNTSASAKRRWRKKAYVLLGAAASVLLVVALYSAWSFYRHITEPTVPGPTQKFVVPKGATGQRVGHLLAEAGLLEHEILLRAAFRLSDSKEDIKYGVYPVPEGLSAMQLLDFLRDASNQIFQYENIPDAVRITIPEGLTIAQTARLFESRRPSLWPRPIPLSLNVWASMPIHARVF